MTFISKTDYILWRACPKNAWLRIHKPEIYYSKELTEFEQSIIDMGIEVEQATRNLFPEGMLVPGSKSELPQNTLNCLRSRSIGTLFQAVFEREHLLAAIDALQYDTTKADYSIYETKSKTQVEKEYLYDLAFQVVLLRQCEMHVSRAYIIHLNPNYIRRGDIDLQELFVTVEMTSNIDEIYETIVEEVHQAQIYLLNDSEPPGPCPCIYKPRSQHCTTFSYSNPRVPRYGIHDISRIGSNPKKLKSFVDAGILTLDELPSDLKLTHIQQEQIRAYRTGEALVDKNAIAKELDDLTFPLQFIDYETFAPAIPIFSDYSPYEQIPLQYSVHIVGAPGEKPIHRDFLHRGSNDPTMSFICSLQQHISSFGTILVWNKAFESHVNDCIARRHPTIKDYVIDFNDRMYDLMDVFSKQYFVHKELCGKVSIKAVLPVLAPELSYSRLQIQEGATASLVWNRLITNRLPEEDKNRCYEQLRQYCELDSYGMYVIWQALTKLIAD